MINYAFFRVLAIGWMILIFVLSAQPALPVPAMFWGQDKIFHAIFYGILAFLLFHSQEPPENPSWKRLLLLTLLVTAYGLTDEIHQSFVPGRDASAGDLLADGIGGFGALWTIRWWDMRKQGVRI